MFFSLNTPTMFRNSSPKSHASLFSIFSSFAQFDICGLLWTIVIVRNICQIDFNLDRNWRLEKYKLTQLQWVYHRLS